MTPVFFLMAILGCGEDEGACQQVRVIETRYESQAACLAESEAILARNLDIDYPVVVAQCEAADAGRPPVNAEDVRRPEPSPNPFYPIISNR